MGEKVIKKIVLEDIGAIFMSGGPIEEVYVSGEMAMVRWFRQGNRDFNGKYVIEIEYENI